MLTTLWFVTQKVLTLVSSSRRQKSVHQEVKNSTTDRILKFRFWVQNHNSNLTSSLPSNNRQQLCDVCGKCELSLTSECCLLELEMIDCCSPCPAPSSINFDVAPKPPFDLLLSPLLLYVLSANTPSAAALAVDSRLLCWLVSLVLVVLDSCVFVGGAVWKQS